jgi:hypothetical protein
MHFGVLLTLWVIAFLALWTNHAFVALNSPFSAMNYLKNGNEILQKRNENCKKCNEILHLLKNMKRLKISLNAERSKNQG